MFIRRLECLNRAEACTLNLNRKIDEHTKSIKGLENYARYDLTQKGLTPQEINTILNQI